MLVFFFYFGCLNWPGVQVSSGIFRSPLEGIYKFLSYIPRGISLPGDLSHLAQKEKPPVTGFELMTLRIGTIPPSSTRPLRFWYNGQPSGQLYRMSFIFMYRNIIFKSSILTIEPIYLFLLDLNKSSMYITVTSVFIINYQLYSLLRTYHTDYC